MPHKPHKLRRVLRRPAVLAATGYGRTQLQVLVDKKLFPAPFKLSDTGRSVGWWEDDVIAYQESREAAK